MLFSWILEEVVVSGPCGVLTGGTLPASNTFPDVIRNCQDGCTFQSRQYFKVNGQRLPVRESRTGTIYQGWSVDAISSNVTVVGTNTPP